MGRVSHPIVRWARIWLHPRVVLALVVLYGKWLNLAGNYGLNRLLGVPVDQMDPELLDPRTPLRQVRRKVERWRTVNPRPRSV